MRDNEREKFEQEKAGYETTKTALKDMTKSRDDQRIKLTTEEKAHVESKTLLTQTTRAL
jgi:hypothetical protein